MKRLPREERRKRIVLGAMKAFARSGFRGTRSRDLAKAAGVSEALIFKHFPNKRAIQKAIIEERIRQSGRFLSDELRKSPPERALAGIASRILQSSERDPSFLRLLYFAGLEAEPLAPMFFRRRVSRNIDELAGLVRLWIRRGWVRKSVEPRTFAWSFMGCVFQLVVVRTLFGVRRLPGGRGALAALVTDLFLRGILR
ncbi:MAG TPA: TetR/AcrR family transcriptional regulator [Planctomycetota bacterium]|nr:TetR/AcrR family transcriptional regulator [Planctomycetota bacterium]